MGRAGDVLGLDDDVGDEPRDPVEPNELGPLLSVRTCPRTWFHDPTCDPGLLSGGGGGK